MAEGGRKGSATRVLTSMVFIALGLGYAIDAAVSLFEGDFELVLGLNSLLGLLMFVLGVMGISRASMKACRAIAVIVCLLSITIFVLDIIFSRFVQPENAFSPTDVKLSGITRVVRLVQP